MRRARPRPPRRSGGRPSPAPAARLPPAASPSPTSQQPATATAPPPALSVAPPPPLTVFVAANAPTLRAAPLAAGAVGFAAVIANRLLSGGGDASFALSAASAHARADVVALALAAVLTLTGLQWATLAPKTPAPSAELGGGALDWTHPALPPAAAAELRWAAAAAAAASRCVAVVAFVNGVCVAHIGAAATVDGREEGAAAAAARGVPLATPGPVVDRAVETGTGTYLANLILYPGRFEFLAYLPPGTAGVVVAPRGGCALVLATDAVRGFSTVDQAWAATLAEKVDATLDGDPTAAAAAFFGGVVDAVRARAAAVGVGGGSRGGEGDGVFAEWSKYSASAAPATASDRLLGRAEEGSAAAAAAVQGAFARAVAGVQAAAGGAAAAGTALGSSVPSTTSLAYFFALLGAGALFLLLSFFVFLPLLVVAPAKFALTFSLGSALIMAAPFPLKGARAHAAHVLSRDRLPFTAAYGGSLFITLWAAVGLRSYVLSLVGVGVQVAALAYYAASYVPGGATGLRSVGGMADSLAGSALRAVTR